MIPALIIVGLLVTAAGIVIEPKPGEKKPEPATKEPPKTVVVDPPAE